MLQDENFAFFELIIFRIGIVCFFDKFWSIEAPVFFVSDSDVSESEDKKIGLPGSFSDTGPNPSDVSESEVTIIGLLDVILELRSG